MSDPKEAAPRERYQPEIRSLSKRASRIFLAVFFLTIFGFSWWMTKGNKEGLDELRVKGTAKQAFYQVNGIPSGDSLLVVPVMRSGDSFIRQFFKKIKGKGDTIVEADPPTTVKIIGILAPPMEPGSDAALFAERTGIAENALLSPPPKSHHGKHYGIVARDALKVYIYKQRVRLSFPDESDKTRAHAEVNNVDLGMVVLQHGQAIALEGVDHEFAEGYRGFESEAKRKKLGVWK